MKNRDSDGYDYNALSRFFQAVLILKFFRVRLIFRPAVMNIPALRRYIGNTLISGLW